MRATIGSSMVSHKAARTKEINDKIKKGIQKAVLLVERTAKQDCPVDTGRLRSSITSEVEDMIGIVGTNVKYAPFVEHGTSRMPAHPFLFPAVEKNKSRIKDLIKG